MLLLFYRWSNQYYETVWIHSFSDSSKENRTRKLDGYKIFQNRSDIDDGQYGYVGVDKQ